MSPVLNFMVGGTERKPPLVYANASANTTLNLTSCPSVRTRRPVSLLRKRRPKHTPLCVLSKDI
jgi:hypothetical protein